MNKTNNRLGSETGLKIKGFESQVFSAECIEVKTIALCVLVIAVVVIETLRSYADVTLRDVPKSITNVNER